MSGRLDVGSVVGRRCHLQNYAGSRVACVMYCPTPWQSPGGRPTLL